MRSSENHNVQRIVISPLYRVTDRGGKHWVGHHRSRVAAHGFVLLGLGRPRDTTGRGFDSITGLSRLSRHTPGALHTRSKALKRHADSESSTRRGPLEDALAPRRVAGRFGNLTCACLLIYRVEVVSRAGLGGPMMHILGNVGPGVTLGLQRQNSGNPAAGSGP